MQGVDTPAARWSGERWTATSAGAALIVGGLVMAGCAGADGCPESDPVAVVNGATPGSRVDLAGCTVTEPLVVPAGVEVHGTDGSPWVVDVPADTAVAIELAGAAGSAPTTLRNVVVRGRPVVGIRAQDVEAVALDRVQVETSQGLGMVLVRVGEATLTDVALVGTGPATLEQSRDLLFDDVTPTGVIGPIDDCPGVGTSCTHGEVFEGVGCAGDLDCGELTAVCRCGRRETVTTTAGLYAEDVGALTVEALDLERYAEFGAVFTGDETSNVEWTGGNVRHVTGFAVYIDGVDATIAELSVEDIYQGGRVATPVALLHVADGAGDGALVTDTLRVARAEAFGVFQEGGRSAHGNAVVEDTGNAGLWLRNAESISVMGGEVARSSVTALAILDAGEVEVGGGFRARDTGERTTLVVASDTSSGSLTAGDGLHIVRSMEDVRVSNVELVGNDRVGLFLDAGDGFTGQDLCAGGAGVCFDGVVVEGTDQERGALAGGRPEASGAVLDYSVVDPTGAWSSGIDRRGSATEDGDAAGDSLSAVGVIGPIDFADPRGVIGPID